MSRRWYSRDCELVEIARRVLRLPTEMPIRDELTPRARKTGRMSERELPRNERGVPLRQLSRPRGRSIFAGRVLFTDSVPSANCVPFADSVPITDTPLSADRATLAKAHRRVQIPPLLPPLAIRHDAEADARG